ncbi:MAG: hypothetical protein J7L15_05915 [Clostridiales bacterium]|nr:hypothetical protein [Clostridiales bacterium]
MKVECLKCGCIFSHYNNIYGTRCPECNKYIEPYEKLHFIKENEKGKEKLRKIMKTKLKKEMEKGG